MKKMIYVGLDVHKDSISVATANHGDTEVHFHSKIGGTLNALDKMIKTLSQPDTELKFVYEAGPCGYVIYRHLKKRLIQCEVIAPSLIPTKPGNHVKTDRRDARQLARLYRAGELTPIYVPDEEDEAVRDLVRARERAASDQRRCRQRLKGFLLRLGHRYQGKGNWSAAHLRSLAEIKFPYPAQQIAFQEYLEAITVASERLQRLTLALEEALIGWKREPVVRALMSLRGIAIINAMTLVAEAGDLTRFNSAGQLMSYFGLVPSESSSGSKRRQGAITKAGNGACRRALVEASHHYRIAPRVGPKLQIRQQHQSKEVRAIALKAQQRLNSRYRLLTSHNKKTVIVITALARELCGFVWAIARQINIDSSAGLKHAGAEQPKPDSKPPVARSREYTLDRTRVYKKKSS